MDPEQNLRLKWLVFLSIVTLVVVAVLPRAAAALPPRPEGDRDARQSGSDGHGDGGGAGAFIELHVRPPQPGLRAAVQWWEASGDWIEVEGWSGPVKENRPVRWWVDGADFGKGPFRWVVYPDSSQTRLLASAEFYLPREVGETLPVSVHLAPPPSASLTATPASMIESASAPVTASEIQPVLEERCAPSALTPTPEAPPVPTSTATPAPGPTFTPVLTPAPRPPTAPPGPANTPLPAAVLNRPVVEADIPTPASSLQADPVREGSVEGPIAADSVLWLSVTQSVSPAAAPGQVITWTFSVLNPAALAAEEILLSDVLPADLAYFGGRTSQGSIELIRDPQIVLVKFGRIPAGGQAEVEIFTRVPAEAEPGTMYTNFATYSSFNFGAGASNTAEVVVKDEGRAGGFLSPATAVEKGVWASAILMFGVLLLAAVRRVRRRRQNRRQEQVP